MFKIFNKYTLQKSPHFHSKLKLSNLKTTIFHKNYSETSKIYRETNLKGYINWIRKNSFKFCNLDPLGINNKKPSEDFDAVSWQLSELEKLEDFPIDSSSTFTQSLLDTNITISDLENYLKKIYLSNVGVEFSQIDCEEEKSWLFENYETIMNQPDNNLELVNAFKVLYPAQLFENFLSNKFPTFKRYSGEGANTLLVLLYSILSECSRNSSLVSNAILSMPHRGRLNILPMILDYPVSYLLTKIQGKRDIPAQIEGIDDVVSHVAVSNQKLFCLDGAMKNYKHIQVSLLHNPSHLEAIYPVGMGKSLAKANDNPNGQSSVLNLVIHGDSAVSGQGIIYESLSFHKSPNCDIGGSLHIVTNNQIGYTTEAEHSRSSSHCTDIFKAYSIPIIHINSDDIPNLIKVGKFAMKYKEKFRKDIVINMICWRKYGHNEVDEPMFTQPLMYKVIKNKLDSVEIFKKQLLDKKLISEDTLNSLTDKYNKILNEELVKSQNLELNLDDVRNEKFKGNKSLTHKWKEINFPQFCEKDENLVTGLKTKEEVQNILKASVNLPQNFKIHSRLNQYFVNSRLSQIEKGLIDWPGAEMAAFGSLLKEGFNLRISGQDVTRGTFSQRHIGLYDQETNEIYFPFKDKNNFESKGRLEVNNSSLSEFGVMLFEYGYSLESPKNCVIWEAQFGDFVNGAQV
jgi:probable 2-oxoglutarate dehydrogenase E1 component DHKTD1